MWKIDEIKTKQKTIHDEILKCTDSKQKELLLLSLVTYSSLLDNSGTIRYTQFPNMMDKFTSNNYTIKKDQELAEIEQEIFWGNFREFSDDYLSNLLQICNNVSQTESIDVDENLFRRINVEPTSLLKLSKGFYGSLGDLEIAEKANRILDDSTSLNFSNHPRRGMTDCSGLTFNDYVYDKVYCNITRQSNIFDYQVFNHEVMHGIDFYMRKKVPSENYYGFHETPTYTIDYLFIDYLEEQGLDSKNVQLLRQKKDNYLQSLASLTQVQVKTALLRQYGLKGSQNVSLEQIKNAITPQIKKQLLEIQAGVMAYGLYMQISNNKEYGINNLKILMKNIISKAKDPDFNFIDLGMEQLFEYSRMIGNYSKPIEQSKKEI